MSPSLGGDIVFGADTVSNDKIAIPFCVRYLSHEQVGRSEPNLHG